MPPAPGAKVALVAHWDWVLYNFRLPLADRLRARGVDVTLVCPPGDYVARFAERGYRWRPWVVERRGTNPAREGRSVLRLAALYRRERPAAVQHFTIKPVLYGSLAARLAGVPTTINTFTGLGFLFSADRRAAAARVPVLPLLRRLSRGRGVHTVFQTAADLEHFRARGLVPDDRATLIASSGVDTTRFAPRAPGPPREPAPVVVLMAARLLWEKGVADVVEAARMLRAEGVPAAFWVAGEPDAGNPGCVPLETLETWKRGGVVEFLGHREDMPDVMRQASVAVLATYYQEGVPRFLLEAAATGLPLVATDIEGCRMVVEPGVNGLLVPPRQPAALAEALRTLVESPARRAAMGRASREIALARFDEERVLDQYEALYRRCGVLP